MVAPAGNTVCGTDISNMLYRLLPADSIQFANMCKINIKKMHCPEVWHECRHLKELCTAESEHSLHR